MVQGHKLSVYFPDYVWEAIRARYKSAKCKSEEQYIQKVVTAEVLRE